MPVLTKGLDVVVVNYKTSHDLVGFLESLDMYPMRSMAVTIVNVEPDPADTRVAQEWLENHPRDRLIEFEDNVGYARACNRGALDGKYDVLALFNADVRVTKDSLDSCYKALRSHPLWGVLGPRQINDQGRIVAGGILGTQRNPKLRGWMEDGRDGRYSDVDSHAIYASGSAYFIKRVLWEQLTDCEMYQEAAPGAEGAFLPTQLYFEESFCSIHAHAHAYKNVYYGPVTMIHRWAQSVNENQKQEWARRMFSESKELFRKACAIHDIECE